METPTTLAASLEIAEAKAQYDAVCKRLLSEKSVLAWIMKSCLTEFRDRGVKEIAERYIEGQPLVSKVPVSPDETGSVIRGLRQEDASPTEGSVTFDIYFSALAPAGEETIELIINVEAQGNFYPGYPLVKRGVFYCGRMLSAQDGTVFAKSHYEKIRKVYSIWICPNPPKNRENSVTRYHMTEENLIRDVREDQRNYDLLSVIMICLGDGEDGDRGGILRLLGTLLSGKLPPERKKQILREEFDLPMTQTMESEVSRMCNLSDVVWARALEEGREQGMEKGMEQGMEKGLLMAAQNLMGSMGWSVGEAMDALRIPEADRAGYAAMLASPGKR